MTNVWDQRSSSEQHRVRDLLVNRWVDEAAVYSPYWAQRFRAADLEPAAVKGVEALTVLAPTRIWDIAWQGGDGGPALLMRPTENQVKAKATTRSLFAIAGAIRSDGVAGKRRVLLEDFKPIHVHRAGPDDELALAYSRSDLDRMHRAGARAAAVLGLTDADYMVSAVPAEPRLGYWGTYHLGLGASVLALHPRGLGDDLDVAVAAFGLMPTTVVAVPVDEAIAWAELLATSGAGVDRVRTVVTVGIPPSPDTRAEITAAWRAAGAHSEVKVQALWAPTEARALWAECRPATGDDTSFGLHTYPDLEHLEILDPVTLAPSDSGDLTYTSAGWHGTALIRFRTGVQAAALTTDPCPNCGRTVPRLTDRLTPDAWQPVISTSGGPVRLDLRAAADVLRDERDITTWRLELRPGVGRSKHERLVYEVAGNLSDEQQVALADALTAAVGLQPAKLTVVPDADVVTAGIAKAGGQLADVR